MTRARVIHDEKLGKLLETARTVPVLLKFGRYVYRLSWVGDYLRVEQKRGELPFQPILMAKTPDNAILSAYGDNACEMLNRIAYVLWQQRPFRVGERVVCWMQGRLPARDTMNQSMEEYENKSA